MTAKTEKSAAAATTAAPAADNAAPAFGPVTFGRKAAANRLYPDAAIIRVNPEQISPKGEIINPKRGAAATRFALYRDGMTVGDYIKAVTAAGGKSAVATADLKFDVARNFIAIQA